MVNLILSLIVLLFGIAPDNEAFDTRVWGNYGPLEVSNVETYVTFYAGDIDLTDPAGGWYDTCSLWISVIDFTFDNTPLIMIERDCNTSAQSYVKSYHYDNGNWEYVDF